jgi:RNA 2',3'-cyclic 3'-phosphodiesterase
MRLFFAIELPARIRSALGALRARAADDYRWVDPELMHLTLAFLGEQPPERLPELEAVGAAAAGGARPFRLALGATGSFGGRRAPRVLWVGLGGDLEALAGLQAALAAGLRRGAFPVEDRPFAPHVTLARRRESAGPGPLVGWPPHPPPPTPFAVDALSLMHSRLGRGGPRYTPLRRFPLRATDG